MKPNVIVALLVGLVLGFVGGRVTTGSSTKSEVAKAAPNSPAAAPTAPGGRRPVDPTVFKVPIENSPVHGSADALITVVEFSDYECPFCSRANATVEQLEKQYGNKLRVVMKQNPLSFHPRAKPAAIGAMAAGEQGKYWEFHAKLFQNQKKLDDASLEQYAKDIGLDVAKWKAELANPKFQDIITRDQALASQLGASGTPAFFINGRFLSGAQPLANFQALIDEELPKAEALVKSGTPASQVYAKIIEKGSERAAPKAQQQQQQPAAAVRKIEIPTDSPSFGPATAKVTIVEWSDFECPFCSRVGPSLAKIKEAYPNDVRVVFRHQPLPFHPNAKLAAEASHAAHEQGKFWEYHDKLFANQKALDRASLEKYAQELGLNISKFKGALDQGKFKAKVEADSSAGNAVGANGTPTFFINGREFVGAQPFESFKRVIDEEIGKADKLLAAGTKPADLYAKINAENVANAPKAAEGAAPGAPAEPPVQKVDVGNAPVKGEKNAPITIVAFSDFECPFCSRVVPTLKQLEDQYGAKIKVAFKNQPLPFHANAKPAAAAALAAHEQGKFWEYHDKLFANQRALDRASLEKYAQELGLNMDKFKAAMDQGKFNAQIEADMAQASSLGANGTPTFFINGRTLIGAQPVDAFKRVIDEELKKGAVADSK
ncbi:Periplasmic thiol:disulfide interchange protein DsbA [Myxococcus hansupus]|uniref:Periplasmic thiol:disulfide interchange protein DsbA n=1 Tax=Pseudomyxococcus hansupus TaxID=1297742 RepID=A0A0H4WVM6_9BACT|nr:thioredoxin [Myxococcus hansupus]AKQ66869.1 Periplasmic thiol:disulfide interchange protein DsbA [Myxococcus hansupus]